MALSRHREPSAFDRMNRDGHVPTAPWPASRTLTPTERQRRYRAGHRAPSKGHADLEWAEAPPNGLPVRLYVYQGNGPFADEEAW